MADISIVTAVYNCESTIQKTINSILEQHFNSFEYIVIDGNSNDNTYKILKENQHRFNGKITIVSESDDGIYDAINKGLKKCTGKLIAILNADDFYNKYTLQKVWELYKKDETKIIISPIYKIDDINNCHLERKGFKDIRKTAKRKMPVNHPGTFIPRTIYKKLGLYDSTMKIAADYDFIHRCLENNCKFEYLNYPTVFMKIGGASSGLKNEKINIKEKFLIRKRYTSLLNAYFLYFVELLVYGIRKIKRGKNSYEL
jgi:glycosyltransferase involved in cell wall biosynthesis